MGYFGIDECAICNKELGRLARKFVTKDKKCLCIECVSQTGMFPGLQSFDMGAFKKLTEMSFDDIKRVIEEEPVEKATALEIVKAKKDTVIEAIKAKKDKAIEEKNAKKAKEVEEMNVKKALKKSFSATRKIGKLIEFDEPGRMVKINKQKPEPRIIKLEDIVSFELLEDGDTVTKGGLGRAIVGGVLFGGVGAIVGGATGDRKTKSICNSLRLKVTVNDINNPNVYVDYIDYPTKTSDTIYKRSYEEAQECLSVFKLLTDEQPKLSNESNNSLSGADEILKYKNLLDLGVITPEEFEAKKKQLLGV